MPEVSNLMLPGHPRYQPKSLIPFFGYDNLFRSVAEMEIADLRVLGEIGVISQSDMSLLSAELIEQIMAIPTTQVDIVEREKTKHDIRAWVRLAQELLPPPLRRWVHVPFTSYDALDNARILQFLQAYQKALKPAIARVILIFADLTEEFAGTLQIGRTHGQHALPITVGFWLATILNRILYNADMMEQMSAQLMGKISGAVGAYNAQVGLKFAERCGIRTFEERVLEKVGLQPADISTQILQPEPMAYFLFSSAMLSASLGQFGRDGRQLMRSEIAEVAEAFEKGQIGSSTMAQKRNPINFENLEGMWIRTKNEFGKVLDTLISEHQRDLVGSCVARDFPIIFVNLAQQLNTLLRTNAKHEPFLSRLVVNPQACRRNFEISAHLILAEPLYIALQMGGYTGDAHKLVSDVVVPECQKTGRLLIEEVEDLAAGDPELQSALARIPAEIIELLHQPADYTGHARAKALEIAAKARQFCK